MDDDQQFCLRWNNHQSTLISVFDTLLENETLVDCTLAAEGKFLKAHKVVLSACSPYFATLLQQQYDKHPIFILKDVKYQELRAMMDYMYRGEVNISQDQLAALLKAAESLQIKGLSDNRSAGGTTAPKPEHHRATMPTGKLSAGYTLEQTKRARIAGPAEPDMGSREGSSSPSRRRRKVRRRSIENAMTDVHDNSNSSQQQQTQSNASGLGAITAAASALAAAAVASAPNTAAALALNAPLSASTSASASALTASGTTLSSSKKTDIVKGTTQHHHQQQQQAQQQDAMNTENVQVGGSASAATATGSLDTETTDATTGATSADKLNHKQLQQQQLKQAKDSGTGATSATDLVIEPKAEYDDEANDEPVEDLTLDEEDMGMDDLDQNAGTSQGGEGSSQGYAPWQHDRSQDDLLLATQEAQQRDPQDQLKFLILAADDNKKNEDNDFIIMDELHEINTALSTAATNLADETEHCTRLDSCQSPDQFFISMVNEFLNDNDDATTPTHEESVTKTSALDIEFVDDSSPSQHHQVVEDLMDYHHFKELHDVTHTNLISSPTSSSSSSSAGPSATFEVTSTKPSTANNPALASSSPFLISELTDDCRREMNSVLLNNINENLPRNAKEISYQRFGRFNTNLPAEVHNFKCHLCPFSCAHKEILLQHFQDKHPT